jgi:hypothetical protein
MFFDVRGAFPRDIPLPRSLNREGEDWRTALAWALGLILPWLSLAGTVIWLFS